MNHSWNSTLFVTPRGLTTSMIPSGIAAFQIDFDFVELVIVTSRGGRSAIPLQAMSVADFYRRLLGSLVQLSVPDPGVLLVPVEVATAIPFLDDRDIRAYDGEKVQRIHTALMSTQFVFDRFRADFLGKASPVQFFCMVLIASARFSGAARARVRRWERAECAHPRHA